MGYEERGALAARDGEPCALVPSGREALATGTGDRGLQQRLLNQILPAMTRFGDSTTADNVEVMLAALEAIGPRDGVEGMIAAQMLVTHDAAMECLRRAARAESTSPVRDMHFKYATKLMQLYTRQMEAIDKHRGKGQQTITVEHVTVETGGQAIVGNVQAGAR